MIQISIRVSCFLSRYFALYSLFRAVSTSLAFCSLSVIPAFISSLIFVIILLDSHSSRRPDLHSLRLRLRSLQSSPVLVSPSLLIQKEERKKKHVPCPRAPGRFHLRWLRFGTKYRSFVPSSSNKECNRILREAASMKHLRLGFQLYPFMFNSP